MVTRIPVQRKMEVDFSIFLQERTISPKMNLRDNLIICVSGQIYIYVDGDVDMTEGGIVNQTLKSVNLQIYLIEDRFWLPDNIDLYAAIYSVTSTIEKDGGSGEFFGKMVEQKIKINGSKGLHGDESIVFGDLVFAFDCRLFAGRRPLFRRQCRLTALAVSRSCKFLS